MSAARLYPIAAPGFLGAAAGLARALWQASGAALLLLVLTPAAEAGTLRATVKATAAPAAGGTVRGGGATFLGAQRTLLATPRAGYAFVNWTENGEVLSTAPSLMIMVGGNHTLIAHFTPLTYTVSTGAGPGGTAGGGGTFAYRGRATVTAAPATGHRFVGWMENGRLVSRAANYAFAVVASRALVAEFAPVNYRVTATVTPARSGTVAGAGSFAYGGTRTVTATPAAGKAFTGWKENGAIVSTDASYTFTVGGARTLQAVFGSASSPGNAGASLVWGQSGGSVGLVKVGSGSLQLAGGGIISAGNLTTGHLVVLSSVGLNLDGWTSDLLHLSGTLTHGVSGGFIYRFDFNDASNSTTPTTYTFIDLAPPSGSGVLSIGPPLLLNQNNITLSLVGPLDPSIVTALHNLLDRVFLSGEVRAAARAALDRSAVTVSGADYSELPLFAAAFLAQRAILEVGVVTETTLELRVFVGPDAPAALRWRNALITFQLTP